MPWETERSPKWTLLDVSALPSPFRCVCCFVIWYAILTWRPDPPFVQDCLYNNILLYFCQVHWSPILHNVLKVLISLQSLKEESHATSLLLLWEVFTDIKRCKAQHTYAAKTEERLHNRTLLFVKVLLSHNRKYLYILSWSLKKREGVR